MNWFPIIVSLPVPILGLLLLARVMLRTEESMAFLSLKSKATKTALQLFMAGFAALVLPLLDEYLGLNTGMTPFIGASTTILFTLALLILNVVVRGPGNPLANYVPLE